MISLSLLFNSNILPDLCETQQLASQSPLFTHQSQVDKACTHTHTLCLSQTQTHTHKYPSNYNLTCCSKTMSTNDKTSMFFTNSPLLLYLQNLTVTHTHTLTHKHTHTRVRAHSHTPLLFLSLYLLRLIPFGKDRCKR